jgi:hypothetical protein
MLKMYALELKFCIHFTSSSDQTGRGICLYRGEKGNSLLYVVQITSGAGYGPVAEYYEHGNGLLGFIKGGDFLDHLSDYQLLQKDSAP